MRRRRQIGAIDLLEQEQALRTVVADLHQQGTPDVLHGPFSHTTENLLSQPCSRGRRNVMMSIGPSGW